MFPDILNRMNFTEDFDTIQVEDCYFLASYNINSVISTPLLFSLILVALDRKKLH